MVDFFFFIFFAILRGSGLT